MIIYVLMDWKHIMYACCVPHEYFIPYAYGMYHTRIRARYDRMRMVWLFVPYAYSYYTTIAVHKQHKYIAIANAVLLFVLDHKFVICICSIYNFFVVLCM